MKSAIGGKLPNPSSSVKVAVPRILESEVKTTHLLGEGAYGQVWKGTCRSNPVAIKYIHPEKYNAESFIAELTILFQANNRHIVQLQGVLINDKDQPSGIVTEFLDGGDLEALLHPDGPSKNISTPQKIKYGIDICKGMGWLAGKELTIIHRDLKPANIMLDKDHKQCKICDFGLAVAAEGKKKHTGDTKSTRGSPLWMAPERIVNKVYKEKDLVDDLKEHLEAYKKEVNLDKLVNINNCEKSDVYSFGVMFWEILTEKWPYVDLIATESYSELFSVILSGKRPPLQGIKPELQQILTACWDPNPVKRPHFSEVVLMLQKALITLDLPTSACPIAADWWIRTFGLEANSAKISDIVHETARRQYIPEEMRETVLVCMYGLLTGKVIDLPPDISNWEVSTSDFGKIFKWFGGLREEGLLNMVSLMQTPGFFGLTEKTEAESLLLRESDKTYLIRLNTGGSIPISQAPYVVSVYTKSKKSCLHIRTFPRPNTPV
eukprot:TRINITY_DN5181_c0_g1_i2.p1 TRINITY_DN5181_c0_g1~~TRINITY_DN5181_c0_g1_i2.p1  ORF type:complete len:502 (-),score=113.65 TRINITY_DN5181_c0_g1_i2:39-1514(-)